MEKIKRHKHKIIFGIGIPLFLAVGLLSIDPGEQPKTDVASASISILPESGSFLMDQNFSVDVVVNAASPVNAVDAKLRFPEDKLEVTEISKEGSIMLLWAEEPRFSNASGTIEFVGGLYGGFVGEKGRIVSVTFRPKEAGAVTIAFEDTKVLAHDGKGTDILEEKFGATYTIRSKELPSSDFNNDGTVNIYDVSIMIFQIAAGYDFRYDLNRDGKVDTTDFSILLSRFESSY